MTLDFKSDRGRQLAVELAAGSDVIVENYRLGGMARLGLDYPTLSATHPGLVFCSLSGFGATGPLRSKISFDLVNQAMSGMINLTGDPDDRPARIGVPVGDMAGGLFVAMAALAALVERDRTGHGSWIDMSLHDVLIGLLTSRGQEYLSTGVSPTRTGNRDPDGAPRGGYEAADGWLVVDVTTDDAWRTLAEVLGEPSLVSDPRFVDATGRKRHHAALEAVLRARFRARPVAEVVSALVNAGVSAAAVNALDTALDSPLLRDRHIIFSAEHPTVGIMDNLASPIVVDGARAGVGTVSPVLGADTASILCELGYDDGDLEELAAEGVIRADTPTD